MERLLIKFTKGEDVKFISHLDTMRTIHRAFRRAGLPVSYSNGFNPHPNISIAAPLTLGVSSVGEYLDVELDEALPEKEVIERLNNNLPYGMRALNAIYIKEKKVPSMAAVNGAKYTIIMKHSGVSMKECDEVLKNIMNASEILKMKKSKKGPKEVNVRDLIIDLTIAGYNSEELEVDAFVMAGSNGSLSMDILSSIIEDFSDKKIFGYPSPIRKNIFTNKDGKWIDLLTFFK
ncbi:MAG: TIGR03936 family radical SAM-associated protein [Clostridium sp.]